MVAVLHRCASVRAHDPVRFRAPGKLHVTLAWSGGRAAVSNGATVQEKHSGRCATYSRGNLQPRLGRVEPDFHGRAEGLYIQPAIEVGLLRLAPVFQEQPSVNPDRHRDGDDRQRVLRELAPVRCEKIHFSSLPRRSIPVRARGVESHIRVAHLSTANDARPWLRWPRGRGRASPSCVNGAGTPPCAPAGRAGHTPLLPNLRNADCRSVGHRTARPICESRNRAKFGQPGTKSRRLLAAEHDRTRVVEVGCCEQRFPAFSVEPRVGGKLPKRLRSPFHLLSQIVDFHGHSSVSEAA